MAAVVTLLCITIGLMYRNRVREQQSKAEIMRQAASLEALNRFKDKAFSVLSHDLRGPVNALTSVMEMFNEQQITGEEFAEVRPELTRQLSSLNLLLDNVLLWAKSHMKDARAAVPSAVSLYMLATQNTALLTDAASRKNITLANNVGEGAIALCNEGELNVVLRNLVMNAIKFTPAGGSVTLSSQEAGDRVSISVTDTGVGIAADKVARLFTAAPGRNTYGTAGEAGLGLGLLICHEFVAVNNGSVNVTSMPGKGSTFTVVLPRG